MNEEMKVDAAAEEIKEEKAAESQEETLKEPQEAVRE